MSLRKSFYFKPLCLLVAALFTSQCVTIEKKLVSTEEKVIDNENNGYFYELEKIKAPSTQDPIVEYRIVKFPANRVDLIFKYKIREVDRSSNILLGFLGGAATGTAIGIHSMHSEFLYLGRAINGFLIGSLFGIAVGIIAGGRVSKDPATTFETEETIGSSLKKKVGSIAIPVQYFPLEFKWGPDGKNITFKTRTDEQGIVKINLMDDLKISKYPPARPLTLFIHYLNPDSQLEEIFTDSLGVEK